jgi:predicted transcriptional regulator of viral defense system
LKLREILGADVITYQQVMNVLGSYKKPRDKISRMLASGELIRLKKGLYVFGDQLRQAPIDRFHLANLIYGPSYISFETALSHYGFIPERVESIVSATTGKNKKFTTPLGLFIYRRQASFYYQEGITLVEGSWGNVLMATPEKALSDQLMAVRTSKITTQRELSEYFSQDLRIDLKQLRKLEINLLKKIAQASGLALLDLFVECVKSKKK